MAEKLAELKEKAFHKEVAALEAELKQDTPDPKKVDGQLKVIHKKYEAFEEANQKFRDTLLAAGKDDEYLKEEERLSEVQRTYIATTVVSQDILCKPHAAAQPPPDTSRMNLPQLKLQQFSGDIRHWLKFWSSFEEIHNNVSISDSDKFQYLLQCIPANTSARKVIDGYPVCAKNYGNAIKALRDTFGKESTLVKVYVREIQQLVVRNANEKTRVDFMELVPTLVCQIRNLEALGVTSDKCECILYPVVESCLPEDVLQAWQRHPTHEDKLEPLIKFLNAEVANQMERSLAKMDFLGSSKEAEKKTKSQKSQPSDIPTATGMMVTKSEDIGSKDGRLCCVFCDKFGHHSFKCRTAKSKMTNVQRQEILRRKNLCFVCFAPGHRSSDCKANVVCTKCSGKHYNFMCRGDISVTEPATGTNQMMMSTALHQNYAGQTGVHNQAGFMENVQPYYAPMQMSSVPQQYVGQPAVLPPNVSQGQQAQVQKQPLNMSAAWMPPAATQPQQQQRPSGGGNSGSVGFTNVTGRRSTLWTIMVMIETPTKPILARVFIDDGSDESYILSAVAKQGGYQPFGSATMTHQLFGGKITEPQEHLKYEISIMDCGFRAKYKFQFNGKDRIAQTIRKPNLHVISQELQEAGITVYDQSNATEDVQLLFGMDVAAQIWTGGFRRINKYVVCQETIFGWAIGGLQPRLTGEDPSQCNMVTTMMIGNMSEEDLWSLELIGITDEAKTQSREDMESAAIHHFEQTVTTLPDGRYEVRLPFIDGHRKLQSNRSQAVSRLHALTKDLTKSGYLEAYDKVFNDWIQQGIIEEVEDRFDLEDYFLPHRHVVKVNSTTPVRPVFDASAKVRGSPSLNECLEKGPNMLELIPAVTTRFRRYKIGLVSDIEKAFLQLSVTPVDRSSLKFFWWKDLSCKVKIVLRHCRVLFGAKPSPFLLAAVLQHHIQKYGHSDPEVATKLLHSFYVDNSLSSHKTFKEAEKFKQKSQDIMMSAHMNLRGWEITSVTDERIVPVLGMTWNTFSDTLSIALDGTYKRLDGPLTKRGLLSAVNSVFDPMGFVAPVTIVSKLLFQNSCKLELKWDDPLPEEIVGPFKKWKSQLPLLEKVRIPRWMCGISEESNVELHIFSDASASIYATCVFIRTEGPDGAVKVQLVMCRARVAPFKKKMTIPRLELMGCLLSVRLAKDVRKYLQDDHIPCTYWTDSSTALAWITNDKSWGRFVQGRVDEIRKCSKSEEWRHVPGEDNPADLPSRGCTSERFLQLQWWEGTAWLRQIKENWPKSQVTPQDDVVMEEAKKTVVCAMTQAKVDVLDGICKFSDYHVCLRVVAVLIRYFDRLKTRAQHRKNKTMDRLQLKKGKWRESTAEEINRAECIIVKYIQRTAFTGIEDGKLKDLSVFEDSEGIIRTKTQLFYGNEDYYTKCPAVLPSKNQLVKAMIQAEHELNCHAGVQTTQALLRKRFWIQKGRRMVSSVVNSCVICRRYTAKRCQVPGAPLPKDRVVDTYAFGVTGVDLLGPLFLKDRKRVWVVLYTCAVYRCVHLELTDTLSTEGFIRTLRRFIARRGRPRKIYSDNGLNFVGCSNLFSQLDWEEVRRYSSVQRMEWIFNPPTAAWWGGFWERLVGLTKKLLRRILGKSVVDIEELSTILCDVEATLNQRPLTYMSDISSDMVPLCPAMFMMDNRITHLPEADVIDASVLKQAASRCQKLREELRSRFRKEYLGQLQHKAETKNIAVKPGDVVLIESDDKKRLEWPWGVVKQVYPGRDGRIRTALVRTKTGEFLRPLQRLFIMESQDEDAVPATQADNSEESKKENLVDVSRYGRKLVKPDRLKF